MNKLIRISQIIVVLTLILIIVPRVFFSKVAPGEIGVRQSAASGVLKEDLGPGFHYSVPGIHKLIRLPSGYFFISYTSDEESDQGDLPQVGAEP